MPCGLQLFGIVYESPHEYLVKKLRLSFLKSENNEQYCIYFNVEHIVCFWRE